MGRLRELSADEEVQRLALVPERALHDGTSLRNTAQREGDKTGFEKDETANQRKTATRLLALGLTSDREVAGLITPEMLPAEWQHLRFGAMLRP